MAKKYIARGDTYWCREQFVSWGWHWEQDIKAWVEDNGSDEDERCILAIKALSGVVVETIEVPDPYPGDLVREINEDMEEKK